MLPMISDANRVWKTGRNTRFIVYILIGYELWFYRRAIGITHLKSAITAGRSGRSALYGIRCSTIRCDEVHQVGAYLSTYIAYLT